MTAGLCIVMGAMMLDPRKSRKGNRHAEGGEYHRVSRSTRLPRSDTFPPMPPELANITASEVARRYGVTPSTVRRWVERGSLHASLQTPGGHYRFTETDVQALLQKAAS